MVVQNLQVKLGQSTNMSGLPILVKMRCLWMKEKERRRGEKKEGNAFKRTGDQSAAAPATSIEEIGSSERGAKRVCGEREEAATFMTARPRARPLPLLLAPSVPRSTQPPLPLPTLRARTRTDAVNKE